MIKNVLTIGGSDSSGGAGIQADLKTFSAIGVYGMSVITALTAQNTTGVHSAHTPPADFLQDQINSVFNDIPPAALKIGMLSNADVIRGVVNSLSHYHCPHIILDPVMVSSTGHNLLDLEAIETLRDTLLPLTTMVTPNLTEVAVLLNTRIPTSREEMLTAAQELKQHSNNHVLLKGGHLSDSGSPDLLLTADGKEYWFETPRINTKNTHGTGCTLSAAIASFLAKNDGDVFDAVTQAKHFVTEAIKHADELNVGSGSGPTHHFAHIWA